MINILSLKVVLNQGILEEQEYIGYVNGAISRMKGNGR
jgi:hypothetical protein